MELLDVLVGYETRLWNHLDARLRQAGGVSLATVTALRVIRGHGDSCRIEEVRTGLGITPGAASKLVDRLEGDGLVVRRAHPHDRRSSLVSLTAAGEQALTAGVATLNRALDEHLRDQPGLAATVEVLTQLNARLTRAPA